MKTRVYSLRRHLMRLIALPIVLAGLVIGGLVFAFTYEEIDEVYDAQLAQSARLLLQLTQHEIAEHARQGLKLGAEKLDFSHFYEKKVSFRIWQEGVLVTESPSAGVFGDKPAPPGYSTGDVSGTPWRFFTLKDEAAPIEVEVAENYDVRTELITQIVSSLFLPALVFVPTILAFVWFGVTRSLRPMVSLSQQVNLRGAQDLAPLQTEKIAEEILPFVGAINRLLERLDQTLQHEREFTDNAAHELRTPLAAMKTQAQVLFKKAQDAGRYGEELTDLLAYIDRAAHLVDQLLVFARLQNANEAMTRIGFSALVEDILRDMYPLAAARRQEMHVDIEPGLAVNGVSGAIGILVRNLVDNAIKYTPEKGEVKVRVARGEGGVVLAVEDSGPGIPDEEHARVFDRFYRMKKTVAPGSGLGLAIVKWVADTHNARIGLENLAPRGLRVNVAFDVSP